MELWMEGPVGWLRFFLKEGFEGGGVRRMKTFRRGWSVPKDGKEAVQGGLTEGTCCLGLLRGALTDHGDGYERLHWGNLQRTGGYL